MNNFEYFVNGMQKMVDEDKDKMASVLDQDYAENKTKDYELRVSVIKMCGYKVLRNSDGKHIIKKSN